MVVQDSECVPKLLLLYDLSHYGSRQPAGTSSHWQDWHPDCHMNSAAIARGRITQPNIALFSSGLFSGSVWAMLQPLSHPSDTLVHSVTMIFSDELNSFILLLLGISIVPRRGENYFHLRPKAFWGHRFGNDPRPPSSVPPRQVSTHMRMVKDALKYGSHFPGKSGLGRHL